MVEILRLGWEFLKEDCFLMVRCFWSKKKLVGKDTKGVIKLIPKNDRKHLLQNWRPITLLTMTYKIIAKVMAIRLREMLLGLIDTQQTVFVAGRNIIDNILSLRLGQEWAQVTEHDVIFVKLDFMKAYDRVAHGFLWDTLSAMGMGMESVDRIKGLVEGGKSEMHKNGSFTEEITIGRGVRQGCPLAPLLFAMTTQPLMRALREEERSGNIRGLNIGEGHSLLHQLFTDDTGICITAEEHQFDNLKEVIREFESASGACLNLQKSIVMLLKPSQPLAWMSQGAKLQNQAEVSSTSGNFLWSWNEDGNPKHSLIAWERIAQEREKGGLGWISFRTMADALNVRLLGRILEEGNSEWIHLARSFILRTLRRGAYQRECRQWTLQESLILLPLTRIDGSPTLTRIMGSWHKARKRLRWKVGLGELDGRMSMLQVKSIQQIACGSGVGGLAVGRELGLLRRMGVRSLEEAMTISRNGGWKLYLRNMGVFPKDSTLGNLEALEEWCSSQRLVKKDIMGLEGWHWEVGGGDFQWQKTTREWRHLFAMEADFSSVMEERWRGQSQQIGWPKR
ncbi:hypothetical protein R1sor_005053 [Riccia sorocarpa]|uniref:Reverse transcriptase domain-containing protein n=1 Tax=Riccia sorocarpa TaxID=122646 RepID=A0ABD3HLF1_9MARC